jgi:hypothetical protein
MTTAATSTNVIAALRRAAQETPAAERCEFCSLAIPPVHRHLLEVAKQNIVCVCDPCGLRFENVVGNRFRLIPRDVKWLADFHLSEKQWEGFALPINLAYFRRDSVANKIVAMYPSPAGATESLLPTQEWDELAAENAALENMQPDIEALLINRVGVNRQYFIVPIDVCFELVGRIRVHWRGLSGGEKVWQDMEAFFADLRNRAEAIDAKTGKVLRA